MALHILYDGSHPVSPEVTALLGIASFRDLIYQRRSLLDRLRAAAREAGVEAPVEIRDAQGWQRAGAHVDAMRRPDDLFLICPAHLATNAPVAEIARFLRKTEHAPAQFRIPPVNGARLDAWLLLGPERFAAYLRAMAQDEVADFLTAQRDTLMEVTQQLVLVDLNSETALLDFLSGAFDVRFFNALQSDRHRITKSSTDRAKLKREFDFVRLLPDDMRPFFVEPFDFRDDGTRASYRMERLLVPDMAIQWIHHGHTAADFARFLDKAFFFVASRARRSATAVEVSAQADALFLRKVDERVAALKTLPEYRALAPLFERAFGGIDTLLARYHALHRQHAARLVPDHLAIGHGDLCFSNMLYSKTSQLLKLIDPRGAASADELYVHPFYDLAKLSHSAMGSYDLINHDMFDVVVDEALRPTLVLDRAPPAELPAMFQRQLVEAGFDPFLIRLCEASLFISMLPLHIDRPRKVLAFAINAADLLDRLGAPARQENDR